jgi:RNA polymerase sigma-B factor
MATVDQDVSPPVDLLARRSARERGRSGAEQALFRAHARSPSRQTREVLVRRYQRLVGHVVRRHTGTREPWEDLFQVGCLALLRAIDRYDPDRGISFASFAVPTIEGELRHHLRDRCWTVRPTRTMLDHAPKVEAASRSLTAELGRAPTVAEISRAVGNAPDAVRAALQVRRLATVDSLSEPAVDGAEPAWRAATAAAEDAFALAESRATLQPLLRTLDARDRRILRMRFVEDRTQQDIADVVGVSQMHVSRLIARAIKRMSATALAEAA